MPGSRDKVLAFEASLSLPSHALSIFLSLCNMHLARSRPLRQQLLSFQKEKAYTSHSSLRVVPFVNFVHKLSALSSSLVSKLHDWYTCYGSCGGKPSYTRRPADEDRLDYQLGKIVRVASVATHATTHSYRGRFVTAPTPWINTIIYLFISKFCVSSQNKHLKIYAKEIIDALPPSPSTRGFPARKPWRTPDAHACNLNACDAAPLTENGYGP